MIPSSSSFAGRSLERPLHGGDLFYCPSCGLAFRYPRLSKNELDTLYCQGDGSKWRATLHSRRDWQIAQAWIFKHLPGDKSILDVGCFDGSFLRSFGSGNVLYGIEINPVARQKARDIGIQLIGADLAAIDDAKTNFDVVTSFDVVEHVTNPLDYLVRLSEITRKGGILIISTGNSHALTWRLLGSRYWYSAIGEHISFINPSWCEWAAQRAGLELKEVTLFSHARVTVRRRMTEAVKNLLYMACPCTFAWLRKIGFGSEENRNDAELLKYPPSWISSKDHFISLFIKK